MQCDAKSVCHIDISTHTAPFSIWYSAFQCQRVKTELVYRENYAGGMIKICLQSKTLAPIHVSVSLWECKSEFSSAVALQKQPHAI